MYRFREREEIGALQFFFLMFRARLILTYTLIIRYWLCNRLLHVIRDIIISIVIEKYIHKLSKIGIAQERTYELDIDPDSWYFHQVSLG